MFYRQTRRGIALLWVVMTLMATIGLSGLAIDMAYVVYFSNQMQRTADSMALAAARQVRDYPTPEGLIAFIRDLETTVGNETIHVFFSDLVTGYTDPLTSPITDLLTNPSPEVTPNAVQVTIKRTDDSPDGPLPLLFGPLFGVDSVNITRTAIAVHTDAPNAGLVVLHPNAPQALRVSGNSTLSLSSGPVHVNSSSNSAVYMNGNASLEAQQLDIYGDISLNGGADVNGTVNTGIDPMPDPLASLPDPTFNTANNLGTVNESLLPRILSPGYYGGGIRGSALAAITMLPGIYVLDGYGLEITGGASLVAEGVVIYIRNVNNTNARLSLTGTGSVRISPPDPLLHFYAGADDYYGVSVFQSRTNTNTATITGNGLMLVHGALYFPNNRLNVTGNGLANVVGTQIVANTATFGGNGTVEIEWNGFSVVPNPRVYIVR